MFELLKNLFENLRTARYVSTDSIPDVDINKLINIAKLSPSADKLYAYKIYALTNSPEGVLKKTQLVEFARCGSDKVGDSWTDHEINFSLLSGVVFYFTFTGKPAEATGSTILSAKTSKLRTYSIIDATINATMMMMAAESMGYKTAFSSFISDTLESRKILTGNTSEEILLAMSVSVPRIVPPIKLISVKFKNQIPYVEPNKTRHISTVAPLTVI